MNSCEISNSTEGAKFEELAQAMQDDLYWVRFFARPCCPAPDLEDAKAMLDRLAGEVETRSDFSDDEKQELLAIIELRKAWYAQSGLCRTKRS